MPWFGQLNCKEDKKSTLVLYSFQSIPVILGPFRPIRPCEKCTSVDQRYNGWSMLQSVIC